VSVVVRPENLALVEPRPSGGNGLAAAVVDTAFLGAERTVRLNSAVLGDLTSSARGAGPAPEPGTTVEVTWAEDHAWLIPA
jgi:hypothetical protein